MAMRIMNNMSAVNSLNIMGANNSRLAKDMARLSAGLKITGAGDDASGYSIAQRMKAQIRGLDACSANVNTGYNMLKTAAEAVECQTDVLKKMREIAMKASDDTYSQKDRDVLSFEADELFNQLDLIAEETTYNGMTLLNHRTQAKVTYTRTNEANTFADFDPLHPAQANTTIDRIFPDPGNSYGWALEWWYKNQEALNGYSPYNDHGDYTASLDFANAFSGHSVDDFNLQGFSVLCSGCTQFVSIVLSTDRELGSGERQAPVTSDPDLLKCRQYIIGINGAQTAEDITNAVYDGIIAANRSYGDSGSDVNIIGEHGLTINRSGNNVFITQTEATVFYQPVFYEGTKGVNYNYTETVSTTTLEGYHPWEDRYIQSGTKASENTRIRLWNTSLEALFPGQESQFLLEPEKYPDSFSSADFPDPDEYPERYEGYQGTNEQKKMQLWRDEIWHLTKKGAQSKGEVLRTREGAEGFLKDLDQAIKYALHVSTDLGSQMMRMEICAANITISQENVLASESTISDADMAKEMVNFARDNLLLQASQSMLAQANSESSSVLSLLQ